MDTQIAITVLQDELKRLRKIEAREQDMLNREQAIKDAKAAFDSREKGLIARETACTSMNQARSLAVTAQKRAEEGEAKALAERDTLKTKLAEAEEKIAILATRVRSEVEAKNKELVKA